MQHTVLDAPARHARYRFVDPGIVIASILALVLIFLVVMPIGWLLYTSLRAPQTGALSLQNYLSIFASASYFEPMVKSLELATSAAAVAVVFGTLLAWLVSRTDMPARSLIRALVMAAFVTPSFLGAIAWIFLAAPYAGWLNKAWMVVWHATGPLLNIYSFGGAIFVVALYSIPYTFAFVTGSLELMAVELEDAATTLGSSPLQTTLFITLPLALPAILSGFIMSFLEALADFGVPAFLLVPARQQVVTTQLFFLFSQDPPRIEVAAAYSIPLLTVTACLLYVRHRILGRRRFTTVGAKAGVSRPLALGNWRWPALGFALIIPMLAVVLPYFALLMVSLSRAWGRGPFAPGNLTLHWYRWALLENRITQHALAHSLTYGAAAATIASVLATAIAYVVVRRLLPAAHVLGFIAMAPFVVPGIVLAIGFFATYSRPPLMLYGTGAMLIIAFATRFLPIAYTNANSMLQGVSTELEDAARTLGAGRLRTVLHITFPVIRAGLLSGWLLVLIPAIRELSSAIFLATPNTAVVTTVLFDYTDYGNYSAVATIGILLITITFAIVGIARRLLGNAVFRSSDA